MVFGGAALICAPDILFWQSADASCIPAGLLHNALPMGCVIVLNVPEPEHDYTINVCSLNPHLY